MASKQNKKDETPAWFMPVKNTSAIIWPFFLISGIVMLVALIAMLFLNKADQPWLTTVVSVMSFFIILGYISASCANWDITSPGWSGLIFGTATVYGAPFLINFITSINGISAQLLKLKADPSKATPALNAVVAFLQKFTPDLINIGLTIAVIAVIHLIFLFVYRILQEKGQAKRHSIKYLDMTTADAIRRDYIPKCWQTSRCRPGVRKVCPNYLERTSCWKVRSGCFCQHDLANYLRETLEDITEDTKVQTATQVRDKKIAYENIKAKLKKNRPKWKDQKERCYTCPIYTEHQEYKFRNLQWINLPIAGLIAGALYMPYHLAYVFIFTKVDQIIAQVKIPFVQVTAFANSPFEWILFAVIIIIILSYIMALTEHILLEWKW